MNVKPMLAAKADLSRLIYPVCVSPKLDGIRAISYNGELLSRTLKPIPNAHVQSFPFPHGVDGELIVGSPTSPTCYRDTVSAVMSHSKIFTFTYYVFDTFLKPALPYVLRRGAFIPNGFRMEILQSHICRNEQQLLNYEEKYVSEGYEGIIIRQPDAPYKFGRSTIKEGALLKLKRFQDSEAVILGMEELLHNDNPAFTNELGRTAHTSHKEGKVGMETLGALLVRDVKTGVEFKVGTGFTQKERDYIWSRYYTYVGAFVKYKYFPVGVKDKPRHPVFLGFRNKEDLS